LDSGTAVFYFIPALFQAGDAALRMAAAVAVELVLFELAAERVAVNSQSARGATLITFHVIHHALNEAALEFTERFLEQDTAFHHLPDKDFQLVFHNQILRSAAPGAELRA
jgi:hypothetical protein